MRIALCISLTRYNFSIIIFSLFILNICVLIIFFIIFFIILIVKSSLWIWKKLILFFKNMWFLNESCPGVFYLYVLFKIKIIVFSLLVVMCLGLDLSSSIAICLRVCLTILSFFIFYPLLKWEKGIIVYLIFVGLVTFVIVPNIDLAIIPINSFIYYFSYISRTFFTTHYNSLMVMMESVNTGQMRKYYCFPELIRQLDAHRIQNNLPITIGQLEYRVRTAINTQTQYAGSYFYYLDDEVQTEVRCATFINSELRHSRIARDRFMFLCMNEATYLIRSLNMDALLEQSFDISPTYKAVIREPNIPPLDERGKLVLHKLITVIKDRINVERTKINHSNLLHLLNFLDHRDDREDNKIGFILAKLTHKYLVALAAEDPTYYQWFKPNGSIKWSSLIVNKQDTVFMKTFRSEE